MEEAVKQTGLINVPPRPQDWRTGAATLSEINPSGDWIVSYPTFEKQSAISFDTMSCTTFSALNTIETQVNFLIKNGKLPKWNLDSLTELGFIDENGKFNCSDRFTAIMSGTTKNGNYFHSVWDSIREHENGHGLLPEIDLPFPTEAKKWEDYHNPSVITPEMKQKAKLVWKYLKFSYSWVTYDNDTTFSKEQSDLCKKALKQAPLHIAIPVPATHAIMLGRITDSEINTLDQYPPFAFTVQLQYPIHYALLGSVAVVAEQIQKPRVLKLISPMMRGDDVKKVQSKLIALGYLKDIADGVFGNKTKIAVMAFQKANGLNADGIVGPLTLAKLESINAQKKTLIDALIKVESSGNDNAIGDHHLIDKAYGCLQIRKPVCDDINRVFKMNLKPQDMLNNRALSIEVFHKYMQIYSHNKTDEQKARAWNGGGNWQKLYGKKGYEKYTKNLDSYWAKVKVLL